MYKDAIGEIEMLLEKIENEELDVDDLSEKVKRISFLLKICKDRLYQTEQDVEKVFKEMDDSGNE